MQIAEGQMGLFKGQEIPKQKPMGGWRRWAKHLCSDPVQHLYVQGYVCVRGGARGARRRTMPMHERSAMPAAAAALAGERLALAAGGSASLGLA